MVTHAQKRVEIYRLVLFRRITSDANFDRIPQYVQAGGPIGAREFKIRACHWLTGKMADVGGAAMFGSAKQTCQSVL